MTILCMGEALIDLIPQPDGTLRPLPGGGVWNTALALGRLGAPTGFVWPISRDGFADLLLRPLAEAGVDTTACPRSDRPTTLAVVSLNGGEARYHFHDADSAGRAFAPPDLPGIRTDWRALFIGGISLVPEPCGATVECFAARVAASGIAVMLDPNIRPSFVADEPAYRARLDRLAAVARIVKLSAEDAAWLAPGADPEDTARDILARGPRLVLLTRGAEGAIALTARQRIETAAAPVTVADSIGAGDSFNAAILAALTRSDALENPDAPSLASALDYATRAAAVTVSRHGADPPWAHEL